MLPNHRQTYRFIFEGIAFCGAFLLIFSSSYHGHANETPVFQSTISKVDAYKFKAYFQKHAIQSPHFFKIDLNDDGIQEFIFVEGSCHTQKQNNCDYHILADTLPQPIALGVLNGRRVTISSKLQDGVRSIYLYSNDSYNDFKPDLYEWHSIDAQYKMTKNTDLGIIEK